MYGIAKEVVDRLAARRGKLHCIEQIDPAHAALVVIDMQNYFLAPGYLGEVAPARAIVPAINQAARTLRAAGGTVVWVLTASDGADRDWTFVHRTLMDSERSARRLAELAEGSEGFRLWPALEARPADLRLVKRRYSAFIQGSSRLEHELRDRDIDTVLIAGTSTNVCCESSARDAMMLDFRTVMLADALAAQTPELHAAALTNCLLYFGDVMNVAEAAALLRPNTRGEVPC